MSDDEKLQQLRRDYACTLAVTMGDHLGRPREQLFELKSLAEGGPTSSEFSNSEANQLVAIAWQIALQYPDVDASQVLANIEFPASDDIQKAAQFAVNLIQPVARI